VSTTDFKRELIRRAYTYSLDVITLIDTLDKHDFTVQILAKQLLRSATSIGANIIEAQAASSRKDFINFLNHALQSANETKFWLGLLRDSNKAKKETINTLLKETEELGKILGSSIRTLKMK
jgi:four helix bundle protein